MHLKLATVQFALRLEDLFCVTNVDQTFFNAAPVIKTVTNWTSFMTEREWFYQGILKSVAPTTSIGSNRNGDLVATGLCEVCY